MYATIDDMIARFGRVEVTRLSQTEDRVTDEIDKTKVERAIGDATAIVDGYLRGRYQVPVTNPPADLIRATCIIARYDMAKSDCSDPTDQMQKDYDDVMKWLGEIQKGIVKLACETAAEEKINYNGGARFEDRQAIFTPNSLRGA